MTKEHENIIHNIAWLRKDRGLTKKRMAEILNLSVKTLSKIERGETSRKLNATTIVRILDNFDITADELFNSRLGEYKLN